LNTAKCHSESLIQSSIKNIAGKETTEDKEARRSVINYSALLTGKQPQFRVYIALSSFLFVICILLIAINLNNAAHKN
jgi:hypothetical protein